MKMLQHMRGGNAGNGYEVNAGPITTVSPQPHLVGKNGTVSDALRSLEGAWATQQKSEPGTSCLEVLVGAHQDAARGTKYADMYSAAGHEKLTVMPHFGRTTAQLAVDGQGETFEGEREMVSPHAAVGSRGESVVLAAVAAGERSAGGNSL